VSTKTVAPVPTIGVSQIEESPPSGLDPDAAAAVDQEQTALERDRLAIENDMLREELGNRRQDREERQKYAVRVFCLVVGWLAFVAFVVLAQGFGRNMFLLADSVLLMLIGSTTATVIGIFLIVANYLFPNSKR
jgi:hypothetical protein